MVPLIAAALVAAHSPAAPDCKPIPGAEQLWTSPVTWIVVGEVHGTNETPMAFADLACLASQTGRPVVVGLELVDATQRLLDDFMDSDGGSAAKTVLTNTPYWPHRADEADGRTSRAMMSLLERLREMHKAGLIKRVIAFRSDASSDEAIEQGMADTLIRAATTYRRTLVVALAGNAHAMIKPVGYGTRYMPAAGRLPQDRTLTLNATGNGGASWACIMNKATSRIECGMHEFGRSEEPRAYSIALGNAPEGRWSGCFDLGVPLAPLLPALSTGKSAARTGN